MSQSKKARMLYEAREAQLHDIATGLEEAREEGRAEGREEEREEREKMAINVARKALIKGWGIEEITDITGLTIEKVERIKKQGE
ncbi:MAG TPA: hypothetical protein VFD17_05630 [Clostridia bacterium]|nr:hypothetical protein [Clostridia bacterium]